MAWRGGLAGERKNFARVGLEIAGLIHRTIHRIDPPD